MKGEEATYQYTNEVHGNGMFFYTDCCGNQMYTPFNDKMTYHGKLCPKCFLERQVSNSVFKRYTGWYKSV